MDSIFLGLEVSRALSQVVGAMSKLRMCVMTIHVSESGKLEWVSGQTIDGQCHSLKISIEPSTPTAMNEIGGIDWESILSK